MKHPDDDSDQSQVLRLMNQTLHHRGPDDEGYYSDPFAALAMRRLSIIDLATGHQPIRNEDGNLWLIFNGEIYNHLALRSELQRKGHHFRSKSDSEVIVHAFEEYGAACIALFNGMFAFAIWNVVQKRLFIARDRLGIKPLYYWTQGHRFVFGSELKAVIRHPEVPRNINPVALDRLLTLEYIPTPLTIFKEVFKLPPGHYLTYQEGQCQLTPYWNPPVHPVERVRDAEYVEQLDSLIRDSVKLRLMSDVPVGAFLSGGVDSSTVVSYMCEQSDSRVRTFSIGFDDKTYNELPYARVVANQFQTEHMEELLKPDILSLVERLISNLDEPLADFSIIPTYLVSELASQHVKVILSGDGGDELFGGYDTYIAQRAMRRYGYLPAILRQKVIPPLVGMLPPQQAKKGVINKTRRFVEGSVLTAHLQHARWMIFLQDTEKNQLYQSEMLQEIEQDSVSNFYAHYFAQAGQLDALAQQQYVDIKTYLVDNILAKVDRMSMAASLEVRVPLLDHRIVEFALRVPQNLKISGRETKYLLRRVAETRVPAAILSKPKQGFSIPIKQWLRTTLRPMMQDLLSEETVHRRGYFSSSTVARWMSDHLAARENHSHRLWALMVFEMWQRAVLDGTGR